MSWEESSTAHFRARHDTARASSVVRTLESLERLRERLAEILPTCPDELTLVLHESIASLRLAVPGLVVQWALAAPAGRRYLAGYATARDIHVLAPDVLRQRASSVPGSREMLALTPHALVTRRCLAASNPDLQRIPGPLRHAQGRRWAWHQEGGARWLAGLADHAQPAIARRLREGRPPAFPPGRRDALLLGGTVFGLVEREVGAEVALDLATHLHPQGPRAALIRAFGGRSVTSIEGSWRAYLAWLAAI